MVVGWMGVLMVRAVMVLWVVVMMVVVLRLVVLLLVLMWSVWRLMTATRVLGAVAMGLPVVMV